MKEPIMIYFVDSHLYHGQHNPQDGEGYCALAGCTVGNLIEEKKEYYAVALTVFDDGDVRDVLVIPKCSVLIAQRLEAPVIEPEEKP